MIDADLLLLATVAIPFMPTMATVAHWAADKARSPHRSCNQPTNTEAKGDDR